MDEENRDETSPATENILSQIFEEMNTKISKLKFQIDAQFEMNIFGSFQLPL